jgi:CSLREA domain-containing protein
MRPIRELRTVAIIALTLPSLGFGLTFEVNSTADGSDVVAGDGVCDTDAATGGPQCTLRAAIEEANAHGGDDIIQFRITDSFGGQAGISTILVSTVLPDLSTNVAITGPGADKLALQRIGTVRFRIFNVTTASSVTISGLTIRDGDARGGGGSGGAILNAGSASVLVYDCVLRNNAASSGGAIANNGAGVVNVVRCTLTENSAVRQGGAVSLGNGAMNFYSSTISGNTATSPNGQIGGLGGGFYIVGGNLYLMACTVSGNSADREGGGIFSEARLVRLRNTIVATNTAPVGPDLRPHSFGAQFSSESFNLVGKNETAPTDFPAGNPNANNDIVGTSAAPVDPLLDLNGLQDNGGHTPTIALLSNSAAIDRGISSDSANQLTTDQRGTGFARARDNLVIVNANGGDGTDIGAFEFNGVLRLISITRDNTHIVVSFQGVEGFSYRLERKLGITFEYWEQIQSVSDVTVGPTSEAQISDPGASDYDKAFYRVRLLP